MDTTYTQKTKLQEKQDPTMWKMLYTNHQLTYGILTQCWEIYKSPYKSPHYYPKHNLA